MTFSRIKFLKTPLYLALLLCSFGLFAQNDLDTEEITINGQIYTALISDHDTILLADLEDVSISSPRSFEDYDEYRKYLRYRRYATVVYPYAVRAIKTQREVIAATDSLNKRQSKKHVKKLQKQLEDELRGPLKKLTKTQGYILVKMIERELDVPMYNVVADLRGKFTAGYWNQFGKLYGYDLKEGYIPGNDEILDIVLNDYDISYEVVK